MSSRNINAMLWGGAVVLVALAGLAVGWVVLNPVEREETSGVIRAGVMPMTNPSAAGAAGLPGLAEVAAVLDKPLQRNLSGGGAATAAANANASVNTDRPPLTLVGTIGNSLAMLRTADGKIELKAVGESVAGMTVVAISPSKVDVRWNGKLVSLDKQPRG